MLCDFTKEELNLLACGFGFFVQDFNHRDDDPVHVLLAKLQRLSDTEGDNQMNEETTIAANAQELVRQLNNELRKAKEIGLRLSTSIEAAKLSDTVEYPVISIRIWKEVELMREPREPPLKLGADPTKWPDPFKSRLAERLAEKGKI